mgnify:CR=1 FL=1
MGAATNSGRARFERVPAAQRHLASNRSNGKERMPTTSDAPMNSKGHPKSAIIFTQHFLAKAVGITTLCA